MDTGTYECFMVMSVVDKITKSVSLNIAGPPIIKNSRNASEIVLKEGGEGRLYCDAHGHPLPTVHWSRQDGVAFPRKTSFEDE